MKYPFLMIAALILFLMGCNEKTKDQPTEKSHLSHQDTAVNEPPYFPVAAFFRNEMAYVDSLPVGIKKYHSTGNKTDSGYIALDEFHELATEFLPAELADSTFRKHFKESAFFDRSTNYATFYYQSNDAGIGVKRVDVVTAKGDIYDEVKSVYIEKNLQEGNSQVIKKLFWKPKRNFQIITLGGNASGKKQAQLIKVVWDNRE